MNKFGCYRKVRPEDSFESVTALYRTLLDGRASLKVRRTELGANEEVSADPLDFLMDVEIKAKRTLQPTIYAMFLRLSADNDYALLPTEHKKALGTVWDESNLGVCGDYKSLYFRVKNAQMREALRMRELEEENGTDTGTTEAAY